MMGPSFGSGIFNMGGSFGPPTVFMLLFSGICIAILGLILFIIISGISRWHSNNSSPRLTVDASVVAKRMEVHRHRHEHSHSSSTWYYATFEVESGDRVELGVSGSQYGLLVEGDQGKLTFQGTRYLGFERA